MRKIVWTIAAMLVLAGCAKKANENPQALAEYQTRSQEIEVMLNDPETTEELFDSTFNDFMSFADSLFSATPSDSLATAILSDLVWYLDLDFRERLYASLDTNTMDERMLRYYKAFEAEKQTTIGCQYVDFSALTPTGEVLRLSDVVGTKPYVLVDFWATWCSPCRASLPALKQVYAESADKLQIVGVSLDNDHDKWADFIEKNELSWLHVSDLQGWASAPAALYGVCSIPATVLIDAEGVIVKRNVEAEELKALLDAVEL